MARRQQHARCPPGSDPQVQGSLPWLSQLEVDREWKLETFGDGRALFSLVVDENERISA